eukprot:COSAG02_NODE_440_length_22296_cov_173.657386_9_plen_44_part_00
MCAPYFKPRATNSTVSSYLYIYHTNTLQYDPSTGRWSEGKDNL